MCNCIYKYKTRIGLCKRSWNITQVVYLKGEVPLISMTQGSQAVLFSWPHPAARSQNTRFGGRRGRHRITTRSFCQVRFHNNHMSDLAGRTSLPVWPFQSFLQNVAFRVTRCLCGWSQSGRSGSILDLGTADSPKLDPNMAPKCTNKTGHRDTETETPLQRWREREREKKKQNKRRKRKRRTKTSQVRTGKHQTNIYTTIAVLGFVWPHFHSDLTGPPTAVHEALRTLPGLGWCQASEPNCWTAWWVQVPSGQSIWETNRKPSLGRHSHEPNAIPGVVLGRQTAHTDYLMLVT